MAACAGDAADEAPEAETAPAPVAPTAAVAEGPPAVTIESPANGAVVESGTVEVVLNATGIEIAPVADGRLGTAHHHVFLDTDVSPAGQPIPQDNPMIVHMGDGRSTHTFENVPAGTHRIIAVLADLGHVPLDPMVADTVEFRVGR